MGKAAKRERQRQNRLAKVEYETAIQRRRKFWRSARGFAIIAVPIIAIGVFIAVTRDSGGSDDSASTSATTAAKSDRPTSLPAPSGISIDPAKTYTATITTSQGDISIALDAANAPTSVNNFVYLARAGFYDGLLFNRASKNFVIQTGSPTNTTSGDPGYSVQAELPTSAYEVGSVAWAKAGTDPPGTAGSQFFIGTGSGVTSLPRDYGYIGKVTQGLDVAQKIMGFAPSSGDGPPTKAVFMDKVTITES